MCGRFTLTYDSLESVADELGANIDDVSPKDFRPRYNIAPTDPHWIIRVRHEQRYLLPARWGLVNSWAKDSSRAARQINARGETVHSNSAFRDAFISRRCAIPADGFFEWVGSGTSRQPVWFHREDGGLILFAGLYESWQPQPGQWQRTFTIITTEPNGIVSPIHDRMPVVLDPESADGWLDPAEDDPERLISLLRPPADSLLATRYLSQRVNSVRNDDPACLEPAEHAQRLL